MKKGVILTLLAFAGIFLIASFVLAINIDVEKVSSNETWISNLDKPVVFNLRITNLGESNAFSFYNLAGFSMTPDAAVPISSREVKVVSLEALPLAKLPESGFYTIPYYIRANDKSEISKELTFKIVGLKDAFEVGSGDVDVKANSIEIFIRNKENFKFEKVNVTFSSPFFNMERTLSLAPYETKTFVVKLNGEDFKTLLAGFYTMSAKVNVEGKTATVEGVIKFIEKNLVTTTKKDFGLFVNTNLIEKKNEGNTIEHSETVIKKNIISRLFTSFSPDPDVVERTGGVVYYTWTRDVNPGETFGITVKTNWLFPFLIILFLVVVVAVVRRYSETSLTLNKRVSFVNAKGGEFALKVTIFVKSKGYIERVNIVDRLPPLVTLYDKFAGDRPSKVDVPNRRIEWNFEKLAPGETRVLNYIIYSKVGVLGKFALPVAVGLFEKNGAIHESESNRAFFVAEQRAKLQGER
ncbi:MAG: hypothetical protein AABX76_00510 [Nanoarchaeota archaeon]